MYSVKKKLLFFNSILLAVIIINAKNVPLYDLSGGDIVNTKYLKELSTKIYGNIYDGYKEKKFFLSEDYTSDTQIIFYKKECLSYKSLESYYHPKITIDYSILNTSKNFFDSKRLYYNYFGIKQDYIDNQYLYGIVKLCKIVESQYLNVKVFDDNSFPNMDESINYKLLLDQTAILRFKQKNQTHIVSSISSGDCLLQVYVNRADLCSLSDECQAKIDIQSYFFQSSLHRSRVIIASNSPSREDMINNYLNESGQSLLKLIDLPRKSYYNILNLLTKRFVIDLDLHSLPVLPKRQKEKLVTSTSSVSFLKPGDIIDVNDLKKIDSPITIDNILVDIHDETIRPSSSFEYSNCYEYNENEKVKLKFVNYKSYAHFPAESYDKFNVFEETVKFKHYGVDRKYLNQNYKCVKITVCSNLERRKIIIPSIHVINLDKQAIRKSNFLDSDNLILRFVIENETHYVARTEHGNCLFQALIYPNDEKSYGSKKINSPLLYVGKILSATNDTVLENWVENYVKNLNFSYKTLIGIINNPDFEKPLLSEINKKKYNTSLINVYIDELH